jgi:hypothetical protein
MRLNMTLRVTSSGQTLLEIAEPVVLPEGKHTELPRKEVFYHEPREIASRVHEIRFGEESTDYVVSPSTG